MTTSARALVARLNLEPHPEGGHYREIYRSPATVRPADDRPLRSAATTIYFLLAAGEHSAWHRVRSDEIWHHSEGGPLQMFVASPAIDRVATVTLDREHPVHVVTADWWQAARPSGSYVLTVCTVAPGFEFEDFTMLRNDAAARSSLERLDRSLLDLV
jgi:predicted cupin superfamily sugar epimerase